MSSPSGRPRAAISTFAVALVVLSGCTSTRSATPEPTAPSALGSPEATYRTGTQQGGEPARSGPVTSRPRSEALTSPDHSGRPGYFGQQGRGDRLRLIGVREEATTYVSYDATFRSNRLLVTGVLNVPRGRGPFPAVVLAHGYIEPDQYVSGQGMTRERTLLCQRGLVAFHVDYRNHAGSDTDPRLDRDFHIGYSVDVLNAVSALRQADLPVADERIALMGRSMGG